MLLELNGLAVDCIIGDLPEERLHPQRLVVDIALTLDDAAATESDELADTVDYAALAAEVERALVAASCRMIERAARIVLETCRRDPKVLHARVSVTKRGAVKNLESARVTLEA